MELQLFSGKKGHQLRVNYASISINIKGKVCINKPACEVMGLSENDTVRFAQDGKNPQDWFVLVNPPKDNDSIILRESRPSGALEFNFKHLALELFSSCKIEDATNVRMLIGGKTQYTIDGVKVDIFPIITKSAK